MLALLCCCLLTLSVPVAVGQAAPRTLTITPATGLENQVVEVSWTGFQPTTPEGTYSVTIVQCTADPDDLADCFNVPRPPASNNDNGTGVPGGITQEDGTGSAFMEVRTALELPELNCSAKNPCSLLAFENGPDGAPAKGLPAGAVDARLQFAPGFADCRLASTPDVVTGGEASASYALYAWSAGLCSAADDLALDYTESNSQAGRDNFLQGIVDVGVTSEPATAEETSTSDRKFTYAPLDLTGVVVAFNITDAATGEPIRSMNLTPRLVAKLIAGQFLGSQNILTDPEFLELNAGPAWPANTLFPLLRGEVNADAALLTRWLDTDRDARAFLDGLPDVFPNPPEAVDDFWEGVDYPEERFEAKNPNSLGPYNPRSGTRTNARRLFNQQGPGDQVNAVAGQDGLFAVLDVATAQRFNASTAKLLPANAPEEAGLDNFVALNEESVLAGYEAMEVNADKITRSADVTAGGAAYPLVKVDYAMVPTDETPEVAGDIAQLLEYAGGEGQTEENLPLGYVPLPSPARAQVDTARKAVLAGAKKPPKSTVVPAPRNNAGNPTTTPRPTVPRNLSTPTTPTSLPSSAPNNPLTPSSPTTPSSPPSPSSPNPPGGDFGGGPGGAFGDGAEDGSTPDTSALEPAPPADPALDDLAPGDEEAAAPDLGPVPGDPPSNPVERALRSVGDFGGGDNAIVLPVLLALGLAALAVGPGLSFRARRSGRASPEATEATTS